MRSTIRLIKAILQFKGVEISMMNTSVLLKHDLYVCFDVIDETSLILPMVNISYHDHDHDNFSLNSSDGMCNKWTAYICPHIDHKEDVGEIYKKAGPLDKDELSKVYGPESEEVGIIINYLKAISL